MKLWVTRPASDAQVLCAELAAQGHEIVVEPLLAIDLKDFDILKRDNIQAVVATSRNGVRAAAASREANTIMQLRLFAVGPGTALKAKELGFQRVIQGPSAAKHLLPLIKAHVDIDAGALLYLAGADLAFDIAGKLRQIGYRVLQPTVYGARAIEELPATLLSQIVIGCINGVILLSPRTAQTYMELVIAYKIDPSARRLVHFCMSKAVADRLSQLQPADVRIAQRPNINEILVLTDPTTA